jgi:phage N-6-adenine-methyltransferase
MNIHFRSNSDEWATPQDIFDKLNGEYGPFKLDVAATPENTKCARFYSRDDDGLTQPWAKRNWCNPPYSQLKQWVRKAAEEAQRGNITVMLVPARTDTVAFHDYIYRKDNVEVIFLRGRLKFGNATNSAPFPSMVVIFRPDT